jgi:zinc protease
MTHSAITARLCAAALLGALAMSQPSMAAEPEKVTSVEGITEYRLDNGFRFLLFPDDSKPVVTINMTVFVGSRHEGYGETGMAHLLEHMLFKGTPTFPKPPKALADHGARFNGTTWVDRTNYFETMPATDDNLEFGIHLEADRLLNSFVKREDLISEMTVVRNEFEMGENNPERILSQRMMAAAFEWHNYGKSTIGNRTDIERVPIDNLQAFYRKFYQVDNCMLIVAGKFDQKKAMEYIEKYFGSLKKPTRDLPNTYTEEPAQDGEHNVVLRRVGSVGAVGVIYHVPAGAHLDFPALEILEDTLTSKPSGRLYKALVESKKASSVSGSISAWHDPGALEITAKVEGKGEDAARDVMIDALENLAKNPITEEEVDRSKRRFKTYNDELLSSTDRLAVQLSEWAGAGDWRLFFLDRDRIEKVTAADVNRVAAKYLTRNNRTVGVFYPTAKAERAEIPATPDVASVLKDYKGRATVAGGEAFDASPENIEKRVRRGKLEDISYAILPKKTRGEVVQLRLNLHFGSEKSLQNLSTAAGLVGSMMRRGTKQHNRQELSDTLDKLGAQLSIGVGAGDVNVSLQVKKNELPAALKVLGEILREPSFPEAELEVLRRENLESLNRAKTDPQALAVTALRRKLSPYAKDNIRYTPTIEESIARLEAVKIDDLKKVYAQFGAGNGELAIVGDFDPEPTLTAVGAFLKDWQAPVAYQRIEKPYTFDVKGVKETIETPDKENAVYLAGLIAPFSDSDPDYPAWQIGNYMLGGAPLASRLSNAVRGKEGLSYGIGSMFSADAKDKRASEMIFAITNPKNMAKVQAVIDGEVDKFLKDGVSASDLEESKRAFVESLKVQRSNDGSVAAQLVDGINNGRTYLYHAEHEKKLLSLQPDEIKTAFKKLFDPAKLVIIEAGDFSKK